MFVVIILIVLIIFFLNYRKTETFKNIENINIFWTGGYDSTFRICQALIIENKSVQPYYLLADIDDCKNCKIKRKNKLKELEAMKKIIKFLKKKFPKKVKNLKNIIYISQIKPNKSITESFFKLKLHNYNRKYNQYEAMSRYAIQINKNIEIGTVGILGNGDGNLPSDRWGSYLRKNLIKKKNNNRVKINSPIRNLLFPIAYYSKKDLLRISKKNGFETALKLSWSCWYPKNGKPCNKCIMCRERIIPHNI